MNLKLFIALFAAAALASTTVACDEKKADDKEEAKKDEKKDEKKDDEEKDEGDTKEAKDDGDDDLSDLPQECQDYIKTFEACMENVPEAGKAGMEASMKAQRDAFKAANSPEAKSALKQGCEMSLKALKDNPSCK